MPNLVEYANLKRLLAAVEAIQEKLAPNELEMLRSLEAKYAEPLTPDPFDVTALNVMQRNVEVRKAYGFDPRKDPGRTIDLPRTGLPTKNPS